MANAPSETRIDAAIERIVAQMREDDRENATWALYSSWRAGGQKSEIRNLSATWTLSAGGWDGCVKTYSGEEHHAVITT